MDDEDSFDSFSSSSDDEFLTVKEGGGNQDREALVRKKLLESFYGKSLPNKDEEDDSVSDSDDSQQHAAAALTSTEDGQVDGKDVNVATDDLDSSHFDPEAYSSRLVLNASVHTALETEENLALQVRTLDSTMQTLVYENYSKFIDATDAIKSIGVSVSANEEGLGSLGASMQMIDDKSRQVEDALGGLRDQVAEKLRIKKLLTRLDTLLKLPATLQQQIATGQYRLATKSYLSAYAILSKHSAGFESLKTIETECHTILTEMVKVLKRKLLHWSGQTPGFRPHLESVDEFGEDDFGEQEKEQVTQVSAKDDNEEEGDDWMNPVEPPKTIAEIFECAGTLVMVLPNEHGKQQITFDSGLTRDEIKSMALSASIRFLDRVLDSHHVELQESMFDNLSFVGDDTYEAKLGNMAAAEMDQSTSTPGKNLVPTVYLDHVLEAATLYGLSFAHEGANALMDSDRLLLMDFVTEAFSSFLSHVRGILLDQTIKADPEAEEKGDNEDDFDDDGDAAYGEISGAMTLFLRSVRELASGLALPEVGIDAEFASGLVEQSVDVTESMMRRRVAQKFFSLRLRVVQECLVPFAKQAIAPANEDDSADRIRVVDVVQMASVALSDGLQMVDDTVRNVLGGGVVVADLKGVDSGMVKEAVQGSCRRFAIWLAAALEVIAGCESSDSKVTIDAEVAEPDEMEEVAEDEIEEEPSNIAMPTNLLDDLSEMSNEHETIADKVDSLLKELLTELEEEASVAAQSDLAVAIAEMCRLAERSVMENINQSIFSTLGEGRKSHKSSDIFQSTGASLSKKALGEEDQKAARRFSLAASRIFGLYAVNRGSEAASRFCRDFHDSAIGDGEELPGGPKPRAWQVLEIAKLASIDCANVFGGDKCAGPVPELPPEGEDFVTGIGAAALATRTPVKGLQLDVERMFTEKVPAYPHPSQHLDFTRNAIVSIVLNVAFSAIVQQTRLSTFTTHGYQQLQVDIAFLRFMLPHYVKDDFLGEGTNSKAVLDQILTDALTDAGDRCKDRDCAGQEKFNDPVSGVSTSISSIVRKFMEQLGEEKKQGTEDNVFSRFVIEQED